MTDPDLRAAQLRRLGGDLDDELSRTLGVIFASNADTVGPEAREKLRGILKHYAKNPHPFRACVRDNMKRFGPGRTEQVCATLKDIIRGTTRWRAVEASDTDPDTTPITLTDTERRDILASLTDDDIAKLEEVILTHAG